MWATIAVLVGLMASMLPWIASGNPGHGLSDDPDPTSHSMCVERADGRTVCSVTDESEPVDG